MSSNGPISHAAVRSDISCSAVTDSDGITPFKVTVCVCMTAGRRERVLAGKDKECDIIWSLCFITITAYGFKLPMNQPVSALE